MSENKTLCPCCGSDKVYVCPDTWRCCDECLGEWNEKMRRPPSITPEMAWKWFCKRAFDHFPDAEDIAIVDEDCWLTREEVEEADDHEYYFDEDGIILVARVSQSNIYPLAEKNMLNVLGWVNMPPVTRSKAKIRRDGD